MRVTNVSFDLMRVIAVIVLVYFWYTAKIDNYVFILFGLFAINATVTFTRRR